MAEVEHVVVTPDERANGWEDRELRKYLAEREAAAADRIDPHKRRRRPTEANHRYNPHRWRG